jgi:orotidine-5'-phosphate decarboxylase
VGDKKRIMTPADAARAGSTLIVVGRPILQAPDPAAAARAILTELAEA